MRFRVLLLLLFLHELLKILLFLVFPTEFLVFDGLDANLLYLELDTAQFNDVMLLELVI